MEFVCGLCGNSSNVLWIILVSDFPWSASESSIDGSDQSVVRGVDFEDNIGSESKVLDVESVVLGNSSVGWVDEICGNDVISGVHVYQSEVSNCGASSTIRSNTKSRGSGVGGLCHDNRGNNSKKSN